MFPLLTFIIYVPSSIFHTVCYFFQFCIYFCVGLFFPSTSFLSPTNLYFFSSCLTTSSFKYCTSTWWDLLVEVIASLSCCYCFSFDVKMFVHNFYLLHDDISLVSVDHLLIHFAAPFLLFFLIVLLYRHCFSSFLTTYY